MSGGGGQALVGKWGQMPDGGIDQIFADWGDPQFPPGKNPGDMHYGMVIVVTFSANVNSQYILYTTRKFIFWKTRLTEFLKLKAIHISWPSVVNYIQKEINSSSKCTLFRNIKGHGRNYILEFSSWLNFIYQVNIDC